MSTSNVNVGNGSVGGPPGLRAQTKIRIEQIARMRIGGLSNARIAVQLQITAAALNYIVQQPEYKETEEAILLGHTTAMDEALAGKVEELRQGVRVAVPAALRCLLDAVNQRRDLRTALSAAVEIMDRDPDRIMSKKTGDAVQDAVQVPAGMLEEMARHSDKIASEIKDAPVDRTITTVPTNNSQERK